MWRAAGTALRFTTAWHPQANGQAERLNQVIEIAFRFLEDDERFIDWEDALPAVTATVNSTINRSTGKTPYELMFGFTPTMNPTTQPSDIPLDVRRTIARTEASNAIAYAQEIAKAYHDEKRVPLDLAVDDKVYIRLHKGYNLPGEKNRKLSAQRARPFTVKECFKNAYRLDIPPTWKIHNVISVEHLEPAPKGIDPYNRPIPDASTGPVPQEGDTDEYKSYEIEKILDKRQRRYGRGKPRTEYLVRWKGYGAAYDTWYPEYALGDAQELVDEFNRVL